mgnify:CR=1 FL=1
MKEADIYKALFDNASEGMIVVNSEGKIIKANTRTEELFGYIVPELIGANAELIIPDRPTLFTSIFEKQSKGYQSSALREDSFDLYGKTKSGTYFPIEVSLNLVKSGKDTLVMALILDVTIRRQTEFALRKEKETAQQYLDVAGNMFLVINRDESVSLINQKGCEILGYTEEEIIGENWFDQFVPIVTREPQRDSFKNHFSGKQKMLDKYEDSIIDSNGDEHIILWHNSNLFDSEGNLTALLRSGVDITKQKEIESKLHELNFELEERVHRRTVELEESQKLYRLIARNFPNGTINVFDRDLNYVFVEGRELFKNGVTSEMLVGTSYLKRLPTDVALELVDKLKSVFNGQNITFQVSYNNNSYELNAVALYDGMGVISQILVVEQNITQQKKIEEELQRAVDKERELNALKSRFVSMASHEFRTPLGTILSSVSLIEKYPLTEQHAKREKHIERIKSSVSNLTSILNDFLSLDRLETGNIQVKPTELLVRELVENVVEEMQSVTRENQKIDYKHQGMDSPKMLDRQILRNILLNLISNAIKYSPENGLVKVNTVMETETLTIHVSDNGMGIPAEDQKHLFERFFRANNVSNIQGTGLGLNIVKKYVELLGGNITFNSEEKIGTTFTVIIPINHTAIA